MARQTKGRTRVPRSAEGISAAKAMKTPRVHGVLVPTSQACVHGSCSCRHLGLCIGSPPRCARGGELDGRPGLPWAWSPGPVLCRAGGSPARCPSPPQRALRPSLTPNPGDLGNRGEQAWALVPSP